MYSRKKINGLKVYWDGKKLIDIGGKKLNIDISLPDLPLDGILSDNKVYITDLNLPLQFSSRLEILQRSKKRFRKNACLVNWSSPPKIGDEIIIEGKSFEKDYKDKSINVMKVRIIKLINIGNILKAYKCILPSGEHFIIRKRDDRYIFKDGRCIYYGNLPNVGDLLEIEYTEKINNIPKNPKIKESIN